MPNEPAADVTTGAAGHWYTHDMEHQPSRDEVIGLGRMVMESRARLGEEADVDTVISDLRNRGVQVSMEQVQYCWDKCD